jgi:hypothetical protein
MPVSETYRQRIEAFSTDYAEISRKWSLMANLRLVVFVVIALNAWWAWDQRSWLLAVPIAIECAVVIGLIRQHRKLRHERDRAHRMIEVNRHGLARFGMHWGDVPPLPESDISREHPFAWDLNVVGDASLLRRIGTPVTTMGWDRLTSALTTADRAGDVVPQQAAIAELAGQLDLRQTVEAIGLEEQGVVRRPDDLLAWAEGPRWLDNRNWLRGFAIASPVVTVTLMVLQALGVIPVPLWLAPVVLQVLVSQTVATGASDHVARIAPLHREIASWARIFAAIEQSGANADELRGIQAALLAANGSASAQCGRLVRFSSMAIPRGTLLYVPFQMVLLWDVNVLAGMERWQRAAGHLLRPWLAASAEWESLAALSVLAHDHPDWVFPQMDDTLPRIEAGNLRHPLIAADVAVGNDVAVGPEGTVLFVTGSNMSGKSTLLRAIGLNTVLAKAGAPVAAARCALPSLDVRCCMRVEDSIDRGVSFFMAELLRLKSVVDAARVANDQPVLYLLDEILQGTNTAERQIASRRVMRALAKSHAIGAVSSHDLELFESDDVRDLAIPVHFAEQFRQQANPPEMTFDYRLRDGIATSTNALALMELLGFEDLSRR